MNYSWRLRCERAIARPRVLSTTLNDPTTPIRGFQRCHGPGLPHRLQSEPYTLRRTHPFRPNLSGVRRRGSGMDT